ncbi:DUF6879 family protein [Saccharopolyspora taberi]|uniref:DUF6879 domain-containing protein n=1 Tax=Saccharopolyspora taberi TaxID=60895 RepID=A0ABN3VGM8_9PSEU
MSELTTAITGDRLAVDEYLEDFGLRFWRTGAEGCWKLERRQTFIEPNDESWQAFHRGDWERALELIEQRRPGLRSYHERIARNGFEVRRVRVVEKPVSPYLIWELNSLLVRSQSGGKINVVGPETVEPFENDGPLPEIFVIGSECVYEVLYGDDGGVTGAIRSLDTAIVGQWADFARNLFEQGEPLEAYFRREIAGLRPPNAA